jgi:hypothetical protein
MSYIRNSLQEIFLHASSTVFNISMIMRWVLVLNRHLHLWKRFSKK